MKRISWSVAFILITVILIGGAVIISKFVFLNQTEEVKVNSTSKLEPVSNNEITNVSKINLDRDDKLQSETDALLSLFDNMAAVPVFIKDEPLIKSGTEDEKRVAYTICENKQSPTIFVKKRFYQKVNHRQLVNILKHELTHAWFCRQGIAAGHDARFRKKFESVGGFGN